MKPLGTNQEERARLRISIAKKAENAIYRERRINAALPRRSKVKKFPSLHWLVLQDMGICSECGQSLSTVRHDSGRWVCGTCQARARDREEAAMLRYENALLKDRLAHYEDGDINHHLDIVQRHINAETGSGVYIISDGNFWKIGFSKDYKARILDLQCANPRELKLLVFIPGEQNLEYYLHNAFNRERVRREWFEPSRRLKAFVERLQAIHVFTDIHALFRFCNLRFGAP